jgi:FAD/FMN-containing dehydrogenase
MLSRRKFLITSMATLASTACQAVAKAEAKTYVNDIHSQLNRTGVREVLRPTTVEEIQEIVRRARKDQIAISIAGGRHAMGGQQFGTDTRLIDMRGLRKMLNFDPSDKIAEFEAGIEWPELIESYLQRQKGQESQLGIAQKQTGADRISLGGTIACNAHGRGLTLRPFVSDVESLELVNAEGERIGCSRDENVDLFKMVCGGYGLFGVVTSVRVRLAPRRKLQRVVEVRRVHGLMEAFQQRIAAGYTYGDFQFAIDPQSDRFLSEGVFSCYKPVEGVSEDAVPAKELSDESWRTLLQLAHSDKSKAFDAYANYYLATNGQLYWTDTHQLSIYPDNYHREIDRRGHAKFPATEMITEIDVPRDRLEDFLAEAREDFRKNNVNLIYGTVRLIEEDKETFLPWAKQPYACTIFNLHTEHSAAGLKHAADALRRLIDMAIKRKGTYYLTYHKYARRKQVEACYPRFAEFLKLKRKYDPQERFQSDWYRFYRRMFA